MPRHPIIDSEPAVLIIDAAYQPDLEEIRASLPTIRCVLVAGIDGELLQCVARNA